VVVPAFYVVADRHKARLIRRRFFRQMDEIQKEKPSSAEG
jgi:hypothetical protein